MRSWCLCQICTCGRHRCPHGTTRIYENSGAFCPTTTEYLENYPTYGNVPPAQSLKPKPDAPADRGQMEGITTFKSDYRPHEIVPQPRHLPEKYKPRSGDIDLHTTYKRDFNPHPAQPVAMVRPPERRHVQKGKLDTVPTYKEDYRAWELQKSHLYKPEHAYQPPTVKFGNPTTFQDDFLPRAAPGPRQSFRPGAPAPGPAAAAAPFIGLTSHRLDFVPHALGPRPAPARPRPALRPSPRPFQGRSATQEDFPEWGACRPRTALRPRPQMPVLSSSAAAGAFDGVSTFRAHYVPHEPVPVDSCKPAPAPVRGSGPFRDQTSYSADFVVPEKREICPASYPSPPGYVFEAANSRGHRFFRKVAPAAAASSRRAS